MTSLMEEKRKIAKSNIVPSGKGGTFMTRGQPIIGKNPTGPGVVNDNFIKKTKPIDDNAVVRTRRKNLSKAYA